MIVRESNANKRRNKIITNNWRHSQVIRPVVKGQAYTQAAVAAAMAAAAAATTTLEPVAAAAAADVRFTRETLDQMVIMGEVEAGAIATVAVAVAVATVGVVATMMVWRKS